MHGLTTKPRAIGRDRALIDNPPLISRLHEALVELRAENEGRKLGVSPATIGVIRALEEWDNLAK